MKRIVIIGASSGMGKLVAIKFAELGWNVGIAARSEAKLAEIASEYPDRIKYAAIDISSNDADIKLHQLISRLGGMDVMLHAAGCGWYNPDLETSIDSRAVEVNVGGFTRCVNCAFKYFEAKKQGLGHIAVITSVAGVKGLGVSATYSASKRYQWNYLQSLRQLARIKKLNIKITDIRPGFVETALLDSARELTYPHKMNAEKVATHIVHAILQRKRLIIIDYFWIALCALWRLVPNRLWERIPLSGK